MMLIICEFPTNWRGKWPNFLWS